VYWVDINPSRHPRIRTGVRLKKILYLSPWADLGGAEAILMDLLRLQNRKRFEPCVVFFNQGPLAKEVEKLGITVITMNAPRLSNPFAFVWAIFKLAQLIKRESISLVMSNGGWTQILGGIAAWITRTPSIWFQHGRPSKTSFIEKLNSWIPAKFVLVNSKFTGDLQSRYGNKNTQVKLIYPGIDLNKIQFDLSSRRLLRSELNLSDQSVMVLLPARFEHWKGQIVLLRAAVEVLKEHPHVRFVFSGGCLFGLGKNVENDLKSYIAGHPILNGCIHFLGHRSDMSAVYSAADIVVNTSIEPETFGMTLVEAGACSRPVIASRHGGAMETVLEGEKGFLFEPGNEKALAEWLKKLVGSQELRNKLGQSGYLRVKEVFNSNRMIHDFELCCEKALF